MATRRILLVLSTVALACSAGRPNGTASDGGGTCSEGTHQCQGATWSLCQNGALMPVAQCTTDQVCDDSLGCVACKPGGTACMGDQIVACDATGQPSTTVVNDCSPSACVVTGGNAACAGPCDPNVLAKSYTGCVYYAVDLPQWGSSVMGFTTVAADQQFAIAVANPDTQSLDVKVERNDAPVGMPPQLVQVQHATVAGGQLQVLPLAQREVDGFKDGVARSRSLLTGNAYRITTTRPASVYQFNPQNNPGAYSNDASLLIPQNALDESYVVLGWPGRGGDVSFGGMTIQTDNRSYLTIVATQANTKVRVTPSTEVMMGDNVMAMHKGQSYVFTLNEFETLNLDGADFSTAGETDFTGTRVEADGPLAVWSGVQCITINPPNAQSTCCCDHLEEQLFPRSSLGEEYVAVRSEGRSHTAPDPEFFRVVALDDATDVTTSLAPPDDHYTLNKGELHEAVVMDDFTVKASKAVMVGQFQVSQDSSSSGEGDPSFEMVPPVAQYRSRYIFLVPSGYGENWILVALPSGADVMLDGMAPSGCDRATAGTAAGMMYDALRCPVGEGSHTITSSALFGLVVEGWGPGPVSYGYTGGMEFQSVNHDCTNDSECPSSEFCSGGTCVPTIM